MSLTWARRRRPEPAPAVCGHGEEIAALEAEVGRLRAQIARQTKAHEDLNLQLTGALRDGDDVRRLLGEAIGREAALRADLVDAAEGRETALGLVEMQQDAPVWPDCGHCTARQHLDEITARIARMLHGGEAAS